MSETQANPTPEAKTVREAADLLAARRQQASQPPAEATPAPEPVQNGEISEPVEQTEPEPTPQADEIDYEHIDFSSVAAPDSAERNEDATTQPAPEERSYSLRNGDDVQTVSLSEMTDLAEKGLNYHRKVQKVSDRERELQNLEGVRNQELDGLRQDREKLASLLANFTKTVEPPDPALAEQDYEAFNEQMAKFQAQNLQAEQAAKELDAQQEKDRKAMADRQAKAFEFHQNRLHSRVPDMAKRNVSTAVGKYLVESMQFSGDELVKGLIAPADSRFVEIAWKAFRYDLDRAKAKQLKASPPSTSSGGRRTGVQSTGPAKPTGKDARDPRKVAAYLAQRKRGA